MSASFSWSSATITTDTGSVLAKMRILVRNGSARVLHRSGTVEAEKGGVAAVRVDGGRQRTVEFDDGSTWLVLRDKGCGCGGR